MGMLYCGMAELVSGSRGLSMCGAITDFNAELLAAAAGCAAMASVVGLSAGLFDARGKVRSKAGLAQPPARLRTSTRI